MDSIYNDQIKVGDIKFFKNSVNKSNKKSFIGYLNGKVIISTKIFDRDGWFKIDRIIKSKDNYDLVVLGERIKPNDLYYDISLEEAKDVLLNFGFKIFEKKYNFEDFTKEKRCETQLIGWNEKYDIWINGTTWENNIFNNLEVTYPKIDLLYKSDLLYTIDNHQITDSIERGRRCRRYYMNNSSGYLKNIISRINIDHPSIVLQIYNKTSGDTIYTKLNSYVHHYIYSDTNDLYQRYESELFKELPEDCKKFIESHRKVVD